jgi:hypothetical protein
MNCVSGLTLIIAAVHIHIVNEKESQELYQEIFGGDRIERWKSWEGNGYAKSGVPKGCDHPLAEIPKVKNRWKGGATIVGGYRMILCSRHPSVAAFNRSSAHVREHVLVAEL